MSLYRIATAAQSCCHVIMFTVIVTLKYITIDHDDTVCKKNAPQQPALLTISQDAIM